MPKRIVTMTSEAAKSFARNEQRNMCSVFKQAGLGKVFEEQKLGNGYCVRAELDDEQVTKLKATNFVTIEMDYTL